MAVQKKRPSMLQQGAMEAAKAEKEAARLKMKEQMQNGVGESTPTQQSNVAKAKSKAKQIKERRPLQVSIHFTQEEKYAMEDAKTLAKRLGIADATVEDFIHGLVVAGLKAIKGNADLLKRIISEDDNLIIS